MNRNSPSSSPTRRLLPDQLDRQVEEHKVWLDTNGDQGRRINLDSVSISNYSRQNLDLREAHFLRVDARYARLQKSNLSGAFLQYSDLKDSNLSECNLESANIAQVEATGITLRKANLNKANLHTTNLSDSNLTDTTFHAANLRNADLSETRGLQAEALGRANVSGTKLPDDVAKFGGVEVVNEATENARKLFVASGLACAYAALAISTAGASGGTLELPIIGLDISVRGFYFVVPILLLAGFGYFHLQMQRVWEEIARLPAVFPDGKAVDRKIKPWLVTGIIRAHIPFIKEDPPRYFSLQQAVVVILAWGLVPLTQGYFLYRFANAFPDEMAYSIFGTLLFAGTTIGAAFSYVIAKQTLREGSKAALSDDRETLIFYTAEILLLTLLLWQISYAVAT